MEGRVVAVSMRAEHAPGKEVVDAIRLVAGVGVEGDAHAGATVQHRSRVAKDPTQPNLRQVHLLHLERLEALRAEGFDLEPGEMGENITTHGVDLLALPTGAILRFGGAVVAITGLRNPCVQLDAVREGLMAANLEVGRTGTGDLTLVRKAGVMAVVLAGGEIRGGDGFHVELPPEPHVPLEPV